jgi:voltage-gated sodium channel
MKISYVDISGDKIKVYAHDGKLKTEFDNVFKGSLAGFCDEYFIVETPEKYIFVDYNGKNSGSYFKDLGKLIKIDSNEAIFLENGKISHYNGNLEKLSITNIQDKAPEDNKNNLLKKLAKIGDNFITVLIILNAIAAGAMTYLDDSSAEEHYLNLFCDLSIIIFIIEILIRLFWREKVWTFFTDEDKGWNIFDLIVTIISSLSFFSGLESFIGARAIRILRELRLLRVVSGVDKMKRLFYALVNALPQISWTALFFILLIYIYGIIGVEMFKDASDKFSSLHVTFLTLTQIMTLDDWSAITANVMEKHPYAWIYFVSFVLLAAYILVNLVVGVVVDSLNEVREKEELDKCDELQREITRLEKQFDLVKKILKNEKEE